AIDHDAVADVMHCHQFGLTKRHDRWRLIEISSQHDKAPAVVEHESFTTSTWQGGLRRLIEDQLAIYIGAYPERIALKGGHVQLSKSHASELRRLFDELVTNAAKYGALSSTRGKLVVQWRVVVNGSRNLHIKWTESGISGVTIPYNIALAATLIAEAFQNCARAFETMGMECTFDLTLDTRSLELWLPFK